MSDKFSDEEVKKILGEAARLAVEKANHESGHSYDDIEDAAKETGIDPEDLIEAASRVEGRILLVRDSLGDTHVRKPNWTPGEPGKRKKFTCAVLDCPVRDRCPILRWENVVTDCTPLYQVKRSLGAISPRPSVEGFFARTSPNGRYLLFTATYGPLVESIFATISRELSLRCQEALGVIDLTNKQAGLLLASPGRIAPVWTGVSTFRFSLDSDLVSISQRNSKFKLLTKLPGMSSQLFMHLGKDPSKRIFTRVDAYRIEG